jgi:hypothetical protein
MQHEQLNVTFRQGGSVLTGEYLQDLDHGYILVQCEDGPRYVRERDVIEYYHIDHSAGWGYVFAIACAAVVCVVLVQSVATFFID